MADSEERKAGEGPWQKVDAQSLFDLIGRYGHNGLLGVGLADTGPDWVSLSLPYDERLVGEPARGIIASGTVLAMMDMAASLAIWTRLGHFRPLATLDLRLDYLRPATPGQTVVGRSECYRVTRSVAFVRGEAHDGDPADPLVHMAGTFMFTGGDAV